MPSQVVYPNPQTSPHTLQQSPGPNAMYALTPSPVDPSPPAAGSTMTIRVGVFAPSMVPDGTITFQVQVGAGSAVTLDSSSHNVCNDALNTNIVGFVQPLVRDLGAQNVFVITVQVDTAVTWNLTITNTDTAHSYPVVVVAADTDAGSQQPWIDIDTTFAFSKALINESGTGTSSPVLRNYGTGSLSLTGTPFTMSGTNQAQFAPGTPPPSLFPVSDIGLPITLTTTGSIGPLSATLTVNGDSNATTTAGHNKVLNLSANVGKLELAFLLDTSGSMAFQPDGTSTSTDTLMRWSYLTSAVSAALNILGAHYENKGNFYIGMYPDITTFAPTTAGPNPPVFPVAPPRRAPSCPSPRGRPW